MQTQTPGPWQVNTDEHYEDGQPCCIWGPKGPGYGTVCDMTSYRPGEYNVADAKLIAAAPAMLEAFDNILNLTPDYTDPEAYVREVRIIAAEAISKTLK